MSDLLPMHAYRAPQPRRFDLSDLIREACESLEPLAIGRMVRLEFDAPPYLMWDADPDQMRWVLCGLIENAIGQTRRRGDVIVTALEDDGLIEIEIADSRAAVTERQQQELGSRECPPALPFTGFDRWQQVLHANGGEIEASVCPDGGVAFTIRLQRPVAEEQRLRFAA